MIELEVQLKRYTNWTLRQISNFVSNRVNGDKAHHLATQYLPFLTIELTNICNANCIFCGYQFQERTKGFMEMELYQKLIKDYREIGGFGIGFTPIVGDPLIDPKLLERIAYARNAGIEQIYFFTNGILLDTVGIDALLHSGVTGISISTTGFDEEMYKRVYRSSKYKRVFRNVTSLLSRNRELGNPVEIQICIRADQVASKWSQTDDFKAIQALTNNIQINHTFDNWGGKITETMLPGNMVLRPIPRKTGPCIMLYNTLMILHDGSAIACGCRNLNNDSGLYIGNVQETTLIELWRSTRLAEIRAGFREGRFPEACVDCSLYTNTDALSRPSYFQHLQEVEKRYIAAIEEK